MAEPDFAALEAAAKNGGRDELFELLAAALARGRGGYDAQVKKWQELTRHGVIDARLFRYLSDKQRLVHGAYGLVAGSFQDFDGMHPHDMPLVRRVSAFRREDDVVQALDFLYYLRTLEDLTIRGVAGIAEAREVAGVRSLRRLTVGGEMGQDGVRELARCHDLRYLYLQEMVAKDTYQLLAKTFPSAQILHGGLYGRA